MGLIDKVIYLIGYFRTLGKINDIDVHIANKDEKDKIYNLRYQIYCIENHYLDPDNYPDHLEKDTFDNSGRDIVFCAVNSEGEIVGSLRLIYSQDGFELPSEKYYKLDSIYRVGHVAEMTRFIIRKDYRKNLIVNFGLTKAAMEHAFHQGIKKIIISVSVLYSNKYQHFGFKAISEPYKYSEVVHANPSVTMAVDLKKIYFKMFFTNPGYALFLLKSTKND